MIEIAARYGFLPSGSCNCQGYYTEKFKRDVYVLRWRKKRHLGSIVHYGKAITKWITAGEIEEELIKINNTLNEQAVGIIPHSIPA